MKITSFIVLVAAALVFVGCEKKEETAPAPAPDTNAAPATTNAPAQ